MKTLLALLLLLLLFASLVMSDAVYFYSDRNNLTTLNLAIPKTYQHTIYYYLVIGILMFFLGSVTSTSTTTSSYNLSININAAMRNNVFYSVYSISYSINSTSLYVTSPLKLYVIPLAYNISTQGSNLAFNYIFLNFSNGAGVSLVANGVPQNKTFVVPLSSGLTSVNVSWTMNQNLPARTYLANILLMTVISSAKGVNYVYFWNITISFSTSSSVAQQFYYVKEYPSLNMQQIISILNSINK